MESNQDDDEVELAESSEYSSDFEEYGDDHSRAGSRLHRNASRGKMGHKSDKPKGKPSPSPVRKHRTFLAEGGRMPSHDEDLDTQPTRDREHAPPSTPTITRPSQPQTPTITTPGGSTASQIQWKKGELLGQGAFGRVYLGLNLESGELLAVKEILLQGSADNIKEKIIALQREIGLMRSLHHENIVRYNGTERVVVRYEGSKKADTLLHIFLEYVPGGSITSLLAKFGNFSESVVRRYTRQILQGLGYLHQNRIVHRDIKGANVLVDCNGTLKLADFGASKQIQDIIDAAEGGCKTLMGTPNWMAPEVIRETGYGSGADIWALGCTVLEMITGKPPWSQYSTPAAVMFHIGCSDETPELPEGISVDMRQFLFRCFQRNPRDRPTADELLQDPFVAFAPPPMPSPKLATTPHAASQAASKDQTQNTSDQPTITTRVLFPESNGSADTLHSQSPTSTPTKPHPTSSTSPATAKSSGLQQPRSRVGSASSTRATSARAVGQQAASKGVESSNLAKHNMNESPQSSAKKSSGVTSATKRVASAAPSRTKPVSALPEPDPKLAKPQTAPPRTTPSKPTQSPAAIHFENAAVAKRPTPLGTHSTRQKIAEATNIGVPFPDDDSEEEQGQQHDHDHDYDHGHHLPPPEVERCESPKLPNQGDQEEDAEEYDEVISEHTLTQTEIENEDSCLFDGEEDYYERQGPGFDPLTVTESDEFSVEITDAVYARAGNSGRGLRSFPRSGAGAGGNESELQGDSTFRQIHDLPHQKEAGSLMYSPSKRVPRQQQQPSTSSHLTLLGPSPSPSVPTEYTETETEMVEGENEGELQDHTTFLKNKSEIAITEEIRQSMSEIQIRKSALFLPNLHHHQFGRVGSPELSPKVLQSPAIGTNRPAGRDVKVPRKTSMNTTPTSKPFSRGDSAALSSRGVTPAVPHQFADEDITAADLRNDSISGGGDPREQRWAPSARHTPSSPSPQLPSPQQQRSASRLASTNATMRTTGTSGAPTMKK